MYSRPIPIYRNISYSIGTRDRNRILCLIVGFSTSITHNRKKLVLSATHPYQKKLMENNQ